MHAHLESRVDDKVLDLVQYVCLPGASHQAASPLVTRNEEQPIQVRKLHPAPTVSHAGQRGRPHRAEEDQVTRGSKVPVLGHGRAVRGLRSSRGMQERLEITNL